MALLSIGCIDAREDANRFSMFLSEFGSELLDKRNKIGVAKTASIWQHSAVLAQHRTVAEPLPEEGPEAYYIRHLDSTRAFARVLTSVSDMRRQSSTSMHTGREVASWDLCLVCSLLDTLRSSTSKSSQDESNSSKSLESKGSYQNLDAKMV